MDLELVPRRLSGAVTPPPSKSMTQRFLFCAALAEGTSRLQNIYDSDDIRAALACVKALGARCEESGGVLRVTGCGGRAPGGETPVFACGESAAVLRFALPVSLAVCGGGLFTGRGRLFERPFRPYGELFERAGVLYTREDGALRVEGRLPAGNFTLPGNVSSQFFSGLLLAMPLLDGRSRLVAETPPESAPYIELTLDAMARSGVKVERTENGFSVEPQGYRPFEAAVEADWSQAAFWLAAAALGNAVEVRGTDPASLQGDRRAPELLKELARPGAVTLDMAQCPDLLPPLAAVAALREGETRLSGAARLRWKESDRLASVSAAMRALGAELREEPDGLVFRGVDALHGGTVDCRGDHRTAMLCAVAATRCGSGALRLLGADCVNKSYPDFWEVYQRMGGEYRVL